MNPVALVSEEHSAPRIVLVMQRTRNKIYGQLLSGQVLRDRDIFQQMVMVLVAVIAAVLLFIGPLSRLTYYSFELRTNRGILIILIIFMYLLYKYISHIHILYECTYIQLIIYINL
jgi:hypothetical protein